MRDLNELKTKALAILKLSNEISEDEKITLLAALTCVDSAFKSEIAQRLEGIEQEVACLKWALKTQFKD